MKQFLLFIGLLYSVGLMGQTLSWNNASFEGTAPGSSVSPPNWPGCQGSPDTQPGCWGATLPASAGSSYMGLVYALSIPTSQESAGQPLPTAMVAGNTYAFSVRLVNLDIYNSSWNGGAIVNIYGGSSACNFGQLLWSSGNFVNSTWQTYNATFTATSSWTNFIIRVHPGTGSTWPAVGVDQLLAIILPVKLDNFAASLVGDAAHIDWQTSEEKGMAGYTVQRAGSDMDFQDIATLPATGNDGPAQTYQVIDQNVPMGLSYYRLRMDDQNGTSTLTEVRQVFKAADGETMVFKALSPNPANVATRLDLYSAIDQDVTLRVVDLSGRVVLEEKHAMSAGDNEISVPVGGWRAGMYRVQVLGQSTIATKPLVVVH